MLTFLLQRYFKLRFIQNCQAVLAAVSINGLDIFNYHLFDELYSKLSNHSVSLMKMAA